MFTGLLTLVWQGGVYTVTALHEPLIEVPECVEAEHNQEAERQAEQLNGQACQRSWGKSFFSQICLSIMCSRQGLFG